MSQLNGKGPNNEGREAGRKLGLCAAGKRETTPLYPLGVGMGKRRQAGQNSGNRNNNK